MILKATIDTKDDIERFLLVLNLGILNAIKEGMVNIEAAENYFYSPYTVNKIADLGVDNEIISLIEMGCELEDIESLMHDRLNDYIGTLEKRTRELLRSLSSPKLPSKKWID